MGYAHYEIHRNGEIIQAGYGVEAICEEAGCEETIDRGLGHLCGKNPGGDEHGCGGYYCGRHLTYDNQCEACAETATKAATWTNEATGEEFDLRDHYLPLGTRYDPRIPVWVHRGDFQDTTPLLTAVNGPALQPTGAPPRPITDGEWEDTATSARRQWATT